MHTKSKTTLEAVVIGMSPGSKPGFNFTYDAGKTGYCFDATGGGFHHLRAGRPVRISGQWSSAVIGVFEGEQVTPLDDAAGQGAAG